MRQHVSLWLVASLLLSACGGSGGDSGSSTQAASTSDTEETTAQDTSQETSQDTAQETSQDSTDDTSDTEETTSDTESVDITDAIFTQKSSNCADYVNDYYSNVQDIGEDDELQGSLSISLSSGKCEFTSNAIPNHDFNDGAGGFVSRVAEQNKTYFVTQSPAMAASVTELTLASDNAVFLNGVKLDVLAAACYGVGPDPLGEEKIGCNDVGQPFRYDPMSPMNNFGTDSHNAHTQPDGTYHYHGNPNAMYYFETAIDSPIIGFAADGYPIFGSYFDDAGTVRKAVSSYRLKSGARMAVTYNSVSYAPGGSYDGTFVDDYEYVEGLGDLDECNGMTVDGVYGYYVTDSFPWVLKCFKGTPDASFDK